jgi:hypothetical protein
MSVTRRFFIINSFSILLLLLHLLIFSTKAAVRETRRPIPPRVALEDQQSKTAEIQAWLSAVKAEGTL